MAVIRQQNWLGQQRIDVPYLRSIESGVCADFDVLAGSMMAGDRAQVVAGCEIISTGVTTAVKLVLRTAGAILLHPRASESGSVYNVPLTEDDQVLSSVNPLIVGSWTLSAVNYVGLDLIRSADDTTRDLVAFYEKATDSEFDRSVPLARTLHYKITISTLDFSVTPNVCPVAKITTDASGNVVTIEDARQMFFRLGSGGGTPDPAGIYAWAQGRVESATSGFHGADKDLTNLKDWCDAMMTRLWELGGGEHWFASTADRNVKLVATGGTFVSTQEYFEWIANNLHWQNLSFTFDNSTGYFNNIANQLIDSAGLTDLADGECLYVDIDRSQNLSGGTALVAVKAPLATLGMSDVPGSRFVFAWRKGANVFVRDQQVAVGTFVTNPATTVALGTVYLSGTPTALAPTPRCATIDTAGLAIAGGLTRKLAVAVIGPGTIIIGNDAADTNVTIGHSASTGTSVTGTDTTGATTPLIVKNSHDISGPHVAAQIAKFVQTGGAGDVDAVTILGTGAIEMHMEPAGVVTPNASSSSALRMVARDNGVVSPNKRLQFGVLWSNGTFTVIAESDLF